MAGGELQRHVEGHRGGDVREQRTVPQLERRESRILDVFVKFIVSSLKPFDNTLQQNNGEKRTPDIPAETVLMIFSRHIILQTAASWDGGPYLQGYTTRS